MRYCWSHVDNEIGVTAPGAAFFSVVCIAAICAETKRYEDPARYLLTICPIAIPVIACLLLTAFVSARRYEINADGMTVLYPFGISVRHSWDAFSEIALCKIHYASASNAHIMAIRCAIGEEKHGPKHAVVGKESWTRRRYEILRFRKVISVYKTDEREREFRAFCPIPIADYRHLADRA